MPPTKPSAETPASALIDERIASLGGDWRAETFTRVRALIHEVEPAIVEEWKWMGTPIFSRAGIVCTGETYKQVVKLTFAKGASLPDPKKLFNSSLDGNVRRAIDIREGEKIDVPALKALLRAAIALNVANEAKKTAPKSAKPVAKKPVAKKPVAKQPVAKTPVAKTPVAKTPVAKKPVTKKPVAKKAVERTPVATKLVTKKASTKKAVAKAGRKGG